MEGLTIGNWISIIFGSIGTIGVLISVANYVVAQGERKSRAGGPGPTVKATINRARYGDGWRSVQLHMVPADDNYQTFQYQNWQIKWARLLAPWSAVLARAENDDYATIVFYPDNPVRSFEGNSLDLPQRFALEFFIKFKGDDIGRKAKFRVTFERVGRKTQRTVTVRATVPSDAEPKAVRP
jgi:hypothetical protein